MLLINPSIFLSSPAVLKTVINHRQKTEGRGRAGRRKEQQNYKSDQVGWSRQNQEEYEMSAVKVEIEATGGAEKAAVGWRGFQQNIIFKTKTTNQCRALSWNSPWYRQQHNPPNMGGEQVFAQAVVTP